MIELRQYQKENFELTRDKRYWAWFHETGTGKTVQALENVKYLYEQGKIEAAVIAAPKTVCRPIWLTHLDEKYPELRCYIFQWIGNLSKYQEMTFEKIFSRGQKSSLLLIFIINIEAFSHNRVYDLMGRLVHKYRTMIVIDESTAIKSPRTNVTKGLLHVGMKCEYRRILSGYPVLKSPEDLYTQAKFLDPNAIPYSSYYAFRNEFCFTSQLSSRVTIVKGPKNLEKLGEIIKPFSSRIMKKDCMELPPKTRTIREVVMTTEQEQYYNTMKHDAYIKIKNSEKAVFASTLLVQLEKLHQIANGLLLGDNPLVFPSEKYAIIESILKNELAYQQVVVWCSYVLNIKLLDKWLTDAKISSRTIFGDIEVKIREKDITDFRDNKYQVLIINPAVGRFGNDFTNSSYAIYFSNSFNLEHRLQSEDRQHRFGQVNKVTYIDLVTEGTIESKVLRTLEKKHSIGAEILKDEWEEWFS